MSRRERGPVTAGDVLTLPFRTLAFLAWFAVEVVRCSGTVLVDVAAGGRRSTPRVVRLSLGDVGDAHTTAISTLITLTPGTLVLGTAGGSRDEATDRSVLVHSMYDPDEASALAGLRDMDERLVRGVRLRRNR